MGHGVRLRPIGFWIDGSVVDPAEFEAIDTSLFKAINGDDGGTWAPSSQLVIGGSGLQVGGTGFYTNVDATFDTGTTVWFKGTERIEGSLQIDSGGNCAVVTGGLIAILGGAITVGYGGNGGSLNVLASASMTVHGPMTADGTVTMTGATITAGDFTLSGTNKVKLASRSITRMSELEPKSLDLSGTTGWQPYTDLSWICNSSSADALYLPLHIPHGATLTAVEIKFKPATGHGALPAVMPALAVYKSAGGTVTQLGSTTTDASLSVVAFEAAHFLTVSGLSEVTNRATTRYFAVLGSEGGANAAPNTIFYQTAVTYSTTAYDED